VIGERYTYEDFVHQRVVENIEYTIPPKPPKSTIDNYKKPTHLQKWNPPVIPPDLISWPKDEQTKFIKGEWDRRKNGYWWFNGGHLEYITGLHYFYLAYWKFPVVVEGAKKLGLPFFVDSDRDRFYHWQACVMDKNCFGEFEITNRRDGKTYRALCTMYEIISRNPESKGGMQSKNNRDGKDIFDKLIKSWQRLPFYWKPVDSGETHPASTLKFQEPSKRDTKNIKKTYSQVLRSEIDYGTAKEEEYDGEGLLMYIRDEAGKTIDADVYRGWYITKECLADGNIITGKGLITSTVEEITRKSMENCHRLWNDSDPTNKNDLGQTISGLYRYFKPAYYGYRGLDEDGTPFIDEFGYSEWERSKSYLEKKRTNLKGTPLSSEKHKYPFTPEEAFIIANDQSPFDTDRIYSQVDYNETLPVSTVRQGNFIWKVEGREVVFKDSCQGRWKVVWMPPEELRNNIILSKGKVAPGNISMITAGVDPYDHSTTTDSRRSMAASYVRYKYDPLNPDNSKLWAAQYLARPQKVEHFYEDMLKQCIFYGCDLLSENNKIGLINYFKSKGFDKFLMSRPEPTHTLYSRKQKEFGIPMTGEDARNALISAVESEIYDNVGYLEEEDRYSKNYFNDLLLDWAKFDVNNWTPHDQTVASGLALLAEKKYIREKKEPDTTDHEFFRSYTNRGVNSFLVK